MMFRLPRFNIYLALAFGLLVVAGCSSTPEKKEEKKRKKDATTLDLHMEVNSDGGPDNGPVPILRANPVYVNVAKTPFMDSADVTEAVVVDDIAGFVIRIKFNWRGTQMLSGKTIGNRGKRIAIFAMFGESRWLAAPVISKPINDGVLTFTPDATREEAERIVRGINNLVKKMKKDDLLDKW